MKMNVKKIITMILVAVMICSSLTATTNAASKGYQLKYKGGTVSMGSKASALIKKAGKPVKKVVKKSCAYKGKDRTYQYKNFILYTYSNSDKGTEYVNGITFLNSKVKTKEGIKIGSSYASVKKKYGKGTSNFGLYSYKKGKSKLQIEIINKKVTNIRYILV